MSKIINLCKVPGDNTMSNGPSDHGTPTAIGTTDWNWAWSGANEANLNLTSNERGGEAHINVAITTTTGDRNIVMQIKNDLIADGTVTLWNNNAGQGNGLPDLLAGFDLSTLVGKTLYQETTDPATRNNTITSVDSLGNGAYRFHVSGGGGVIGASTGGQNQSCTIKAGTGATGLSIVLGPDQSFTNDKAKVGDTFTILSDWLGAGSGGASATITVSAINAVAATTADIIARVKGFATAKAVSAMKVWNDRSYRVTNADGTGACKLVAAAPGAGEMNMIATDSTGNTYYVTRLFECLAVVTQKTGSSYQFATGSRVKWSESAAVLNTSVKI